MDSTISIKSFFSVKCQVCPMNRIIVQGVILKLQLKQMGIVHRVGLNVSDVKIFLQFPMIQMKKGM